MHLSWFIYLFSLILFSIGSHGEDDDIYEDSDDIHHAIYDDTNTINKPNTTDNSLILDDSIDDLTENSTLSTTLTTTTTTTTTIKTTTKSHLHLYDDEEEEVYPNDSYEDKTVSIIVNPTESKTTTYSTSSSSSSKEIRLSTTSTTETTKVSTIWSFGSNTDIINEYDDSKYFTTTTDSTRIAEFLTKSNRNRLLLKIFVITVIICMISLTAVLITIHIIRKTRRYDGYHTTANPSSNGQSKHLNVKP